MKVCRLQGQQGNMVFVQFFCCSLEFCSCSNEKAARVLAMRWRDSSHLIFVQRSPCFLMVVLLHVSVSVKCVCPFGPLVHPVTHLLSAFAHFSHL